MTVTDTHRNSTIRPPESVLLRALMPGYRVMCNPGIINPEKAITAIAMIATMIVRMIVAGIPAIANLTRKFTMDQNGMFMSTIFTCCGCGLVGSIPINLRPHLMHAVAPFSFAVWHLGHSMIYRSRIGLKMKLTA